MKLFKSVIVALLLVALCAPALTAESTKTEIAEFSTFLVGHNKWFCFWPFSKMSRCQEPAPETSATPSNSQKSAVKNDKKDGKKEKKSKKQKKDEKKAASTDAAKEDSDASPIEVGASTSAEKKDTGKSLFETSN